MLFVIALCYILSHITETVSWDIQEGKEKENSFYIAALKQHNESNIIINELERNKKLYDKTLQSIYHYVLQYPSTFACFRLTRVRNDWKNMNAHYGYW